jgi:hypothetical protein
MDGFRKRHQGINVKEPLLSLEEDSTGPLVESRLLESIEKLLKPVDL